MPLLTTNDTTYLLDNQPLTLVAGSLCYFRMPPSTWKDRLAKTVALGCNAVELYVPWNMHERHRGSFCFSGRADIAAFIRLCAPLRLSFGESLHLKMGKSLLCLQAKRSRWLRLRMRLNLLRLGGALRDDAASSGSPDCWPPAPQPRTARSSDASAAEKQQAAGTAAAAAAAGEGGASSSGAGPSSAAGPSADAGE